MNAKGGSPAHEGKGIRESVARCVRQMLRPVVRLCVRHSVQLNELVELLKAEYVSVADENLVKTGVSASASRVSAITGVHRRDIARLRSSGPELKRELNLIARVMTQWQHDSRFQTKNGLPRLLDTSGRKSEFATLVESVNGGDVSAYAVLFEMERQGVVERQGGAVKLLWRDFVLDSDIGEGLGALGSDFQDLGYAVEENLFGNPETRNLHLKTEFDNVELSALPRIRKWLLEEGSQFHQRVREFLSGYDLDLSRHRNAGPGGARVVFGTFSLASQEVTNQGGVE